MSATILVADDDRAIRTVLNQALGRLVRAPGQRARVLLHCRRFLEPAYASLLAPDYQFGANLLADSDLAGWLAKS